MHDATPEIQIPPPLARLKVVMDLLTMARQLTTLLLEAILKKNHGEHSVGVYMRRYREVGASFPPIHLKQSKVGETFDDHQSRLKLNTTN
jgi:hypothetical protein